MATNPFDQFDTPSTNTFDQFDKQPEPEKASSARRLGDLGISVAKGIIGVPESAVGLANIVTGGRAGKAAESVGFQPKRAKEILSEFYSPQQKAENAEVEQADGFMPTLGAMVQNPSTIVNTVAESVPSMLAGGAIGRGIMKAAPAVSGVGAAAIGEGVVGAGQSAESIRQQTSDGLLTGQQSAIAGGVGALTGAISFGAGRLANKLGIGDIDTQIATGKLGSGTATNKGIIRKTTEGILSEGVLEEMPQSAQEQIGQNIALDKPYDEGVGSAMAQGLLSGGLMGAGGAAVGHFGEKQTPLPIPDPTGEVPPPPAGLPYNPTAGTNTIFPDGSIIMNSDQPAGEQAVFDKRFAPQPIKPSEAMGINPNAGPLSKAAATAVDTGAHALQSAAPILPEVTQNGQIQTETPLESATNTIADKAMNTPSTSVNNAVNQPFGSAYAQRQASAPAIQPNDILNAEGKPFLTGFSAKKAATDAGDGYRPFKIGEKQFVVRYFEPETATKTIATEASNTPDTAEKTPVLQQPKEPNGTQTTEAVQTAQERPQAPIAEPLNVPPRTSDTGGSDRDVNVPAGNRNLADSGWTMLPQRGKAGIPTSPAAVPGTPEAAQKADLGDSIPAKNAAIVKSPQLYAEFDGKRFPVSNVQDASDKWSQFRDRANGGASEIGNGVPITDESGKVVARISYNGRIWSPDGKEFAEKPLAPQIAEAAHEAATSPKNNLPEPTQAQKEAGNYKKGHTTLHGLDISIENPVGSTRSGTDANGKKWSNTMRHHYGYFKGTVGMDKDHIDTFIGDKPESQKVFVVDQIDPATGKPDEHKVMLGFETLEDAQKAYQSNYAKGWKGAKATTETTVDEFKKWLKEGDTKKPFAVPAGLAKMRAGKASKAIERIAKGTAYFSTTAKAQEFIDSNGLKETHEFVKSASVANRWDVVAKAVLVESVKPIVKDTDNERVDGNPKNSMPMPELDGFKLGDVVDVPSRTIGTSKITRLYTYDLSGFSNPLSMATIVNGEGATLNLNLSELVKPKITRQDAVKKATDAAKDVFAKGGTEFDANRAATDSLIDQMADTPDISISDDAPAAVKAAKPITNVIKAAKDSGKLIIANADSKIQPKTPVDGVSIAETAIKDVAKEPEVSEKTKAINLLSALQAKQAQNGRIGDDRLESQINQVKKLISSLDKADGQNDELDSEMRGYEEKAEAEKAGTLDSLNEKEKAAKAKMFNALGKLAQLASKNTRMNWTPEEEQKLLPIVIELFDGAMELGAVTFQKAVKYVRDFIAQGIDQETADAIPFDTLQGAYIATSGRHKDKGVTPKKEVAGFESLVELEAVDKPTLADTFYEAIKSNGMPKDNPALRKMVESFDGKPADNARLKEAQEELEAAIARTTRDVIDKGESQRETFDALLRLYNSQPLLNIRTSTSIANQAYSTPAPLAYLASELAGITKSDTVLEPTGGTGMLIAGADPRKTLANELNDHRADLLRAQGFTVTQDDAANGFNGTFDKVNTNPPFGSVKDDKGNPIKVQVDGYRLGQIDHLIAARALSAMKADGKATLILGANKVAGGISNDDLIFFNWLYGHYNVTGHFEVEGDLYARQGAGWPVRVISINGRQKSNKTSPIAGTVKRADNWSQVYEYFENSLASSRTESNPSATTSSSSTGADEANSKPVRAVTSKPPTGANQRQPAGRNGDNGDVAGAVAGAIPDSGKSADKPMGASADTKRLDAAATEPDRLEAEGDTTGVRGDKPATIARTSAVGENEFQANYIPRSSRKDEGVLIPVNMKDPTQDALSKLEDAVGNIDDYAVKELGYANTEELHDALMGLQVDSVASAIYQIKQGNGIVIADQTGIGKGRQAAAIIRWAEKQGHIPIFVTVKPSLFTDMYGDLADIGTNDINPFIMNGSEWISGANGEKLFANKPLTHKNKLSTIAATGELPTGSNALFMTYSQINVDNVQRKALTALTDKAVFILDESHNAGGASATGEFITSVLGTAKGVTYLSATYAKRPDNMPLYFKTDIGKASADNEGLMNAMAAGGLPLQTVVSNNLVKAGQMFRRERSYDGVNIESKTDSSNQKTHEALSDKTTAALRAIVAADAMFHEVYVKELQKQLAKEGGRAIDNAGNQAQDSVQHTEFSSVVHNFVRQMLLGLKAQSAADDAIAALKRGEKPIIAVENTMGSFLNEYASANGVTQGGNLGSFDYRTVLSRALARTRVMTEQKANGDKVKKEIPLSALDGMTRSAYAQAQDVIDGLDLDIPVSPIDWMRSQIQKAGYSVAEITGRALSVDYSNPQLPMLSAISAQEQNDKVQTTRLFNSGKLDALILNVAGSTGISLHASEKFTDQRQRHMIVAQPAQDINIFMQMLGRIHRTGQVKLPKYTILSVDLPTEKRPTALLSKKMKSLNANTSSNTESATSVKTADMLNKYGDQIVGQYLKDNYHLTEALGLDGVMDGDEAVEDIARKATGRLALQPISVQNAFYSEVEGQYNALLEYLNKTNQNDLEPRTFDFDAKELKQEILFEGADKNSPFGEDAIYGEYSIKAQGLPMKPNEINTEIQENLGGKTSEDHILELSGSLSKQFDDFYKTLPEGVQQETARKVLADGTRFLQEHRIGKTFRVDINGDTFNAVVTNIRSTHKTTGNPLSMSKIQVSIAVNGALRHISVPATQFQKIEVSTIGTGYTIEQLFKEQPSDQRETAKIVTGNLLAAYGEIDGARGTIISFTKTDGTTEQGILLPKTFDFTKNTRGDYRLPTGEIALKFLQESNNNDIGRFGIMSRDSVVRVLPNGKGISVMVPKSKLKGGKYFLDQGLIGALGDFVTAGNYMKATTNNPAGAVNALDLLMKKQALYALPSMAEEAKEIAEKSGTRFSRGQSMIGLPTAQVQSITDAIKSKWSNAPEIIVAANMGDSAIPQAVRDYNDGQLSQGAEGSPEGFLYAGKVYLIADQLTTPKDVVRVLFHETLGHVGLRGAFGDSLKPILQQISMFRKAEVSAKAKEYGLDMAKESDRLIAAEEVLAVMAQTKPEMGFVKRAVAAIRNWLRNHGVNLVLSNDDIIANYILPARAWVQKGKDANINSDGLLKSMKAGTWYSELSRQVMANKSNAMPAGMWVGWIESLKTKGVKPDEIEWSGVQDWLKLQTGKVTKAQITEYLDANGVQVQETVLHNAKNEATFRARLMEMDDYELEREADESGVDVYGIDTDRQTAIDQILYNYRNGLGSELNREIEQPKYQQYQLPGGENYREVLLTLPKDKGADGTKGAITFKTEDAVDDFMTDLSAMGLESLDYGATDDASGKRTVVEFDGLMQSEKAKIEFHLNNFYDSTIKYEEGAKSAPFYRSSHWDTPNVLAHIRLNDRTDADGKRVLFVEELQSDFGQDYKKTKDAINKAVDDDFNGIIERMKKYGVLEVECD